MQPRLKRPLKKVFLLSPAANLKWKILMETFAQNKALGRSTEYVRLKVDGLSDGKLRVIFNQISINPIQFIRIHSIIN